MGAMLDTFVLSYARTPIGGLLGDLKALKASDLGAAAIAAALERACINGDAVERVYMGSVLLGGQGQAPARQAAIKAGLPKSVPCSTISKVCGSGMEAALLGHATIQAGWADVVIAGGMESMTNAPYLLEKARQGARLGHGRVIDSMFYDGLEDAYDSGRLMGCYADSMAFKYNLSREAQDAYAIETLSRAKAAQATGAFETEIVAVNVPGKSPTVVTEDEQPSKGRPDKIPTLRPAFGVEGTVTAANASSISDGAAALVLAGGSYVQANGLEPIARICGVAVHAGEPAEFPAAPVSAMRKLIKQLGWTVDDIDLFEVNEAFAMVPMIVMHELGISHDKLNVNGGACALGHPIGASGARILATLLNALKNRGKKRGLASICIGGGEATAIAFERL